MHGDIDFKLNSLFTKSSQVSKHDFALRGHAFKLYVPNPHTDMLKYDFVYRVVKAWNALPAFVCEADSLPILKYRLINHNYA